MSSVATHRRATAFAAFLAAFLAALLAAGCASGDAGYERHLLVPAAGHGPRVLGVTAHPDDEISFAATFYKTATALGGTCDLLTITNGEAGFRYSTLAEPIYGARLTDPEVGRAQLPAIRKRELIAGCTWLRLNALFTLGETDHRNTEDQGEVLADGARVWDLDRVRRALRRVLAEGRYDFVLTHIPHPETHGHHKAATILALEAVQEMPVGKRPVVLGAGGARKADGVAPFTVLEGFPLTRVHTETGPFVFDRAEKLGHDGRLNYQIVVNWAIAEHKSQGTMQSMISTPRKETFWLYALEVPNAAARATAWFGRLAPPATTP